MVYVEDSACRHSVCQVKRRYSTENKNDDIQGPQSPANSR